jgi:hypothetical protein
MKKQTIKASSTAKMMLTVFSLFDLSSFIFPRFSLANYTLGFFFSKHRLKPEKRKRRKW